MGDTSESKDTKKAVISEYLPISKDYWDRLPIRCHVLLEIPDELIKTAGSLARALRDDSDFVLFRHTLVIQSGSGSFELYSTECVVERAAVTAVWASWKHLLYLQDDKTKLNYVCADGSKRAFTDARMYSTLFPPAIPVSSEILEAIPDI
jgi:hypothetical protein